MSRFGSTATFYYCPGTSTMNSFGTYIVLTPDAMPQYPFEGTTNSDRQILVAKSGDMWIYENYNLPSYIFSWSNLDEDTKDALKTMYNSLPLLTFNTNSTTWGTFRIDMDTTRNAGLWDDKETAFGLFDVQLTITQLPT